MTDLLVWVLKAVATAIAFWFAAGVVDALIYELRCEYLRDANGSTLFRLSPRHRRWWRRVSRR